MHLGYNEADLELDSVVQSVNARSEVDFLIASGDITEKGFDEELERAKETLEKLNIPYYIIPGNHDTKWSESGTLKFIELWGDDKFAFTEKGTKFIGLNSGIPWRGGGGHIAPQDLSWLKEELSNTEKGTEIVFVVHHPLDKSIDNWYKVTNLLRGYDTELVLCGHGHTNKKMDFNGLDGVMGRAVISKDRDSWGWTMVENLKDSILFREVTRDSVSSVWGTLSKVDSIRAPQVDSSEFIQYDTTNTNIKWRKDLNSTLSAYLLHWDNNIYAAEKNGFVTCYDSTGSLIWEYDAFGTIMSRPTIADGMIAIATVQGDLVTLDAETGESLQGIVFDESITSQLITIDYKGNKELMIPKKTDSKAAVVFGTGEGNVYCYDLETLQLLWKNKEPNGMVQTKPVIVDDKIIFGAWDGHLYCIDAKEGWMVWKWTERDNFYYSPAACIPVTDGENVYVCTPEKKVFSIDLQLGQTNWVNEKTKAWGAIGIMDDKKTLLIKGMENKFYTILAKRGKGRIEYNIGYGLDTMPVTPIEADGNVFFGSKNGNIYRVNLSTKKYKTLFFMGTARTHTIVELGNIKFAASNMDGKIMVFEYAENKK